jgi:AsmA protein
LAADYQFNLRSGTLSLSGMQAKLAGEGLGVSGLAASAKGDFAANTAKGECSASRILLEAKGSLGKDSFEASIDVPNLSLGGEAARGESLNARFGLKGVDRAAEATLKLASLRGSAKALEVSGIALQFDARAGTTTAKGSLGGELQANPAEQRYELRKLEGVLALASPALAGKSPTVTLGGELRADLAKESIAANLNAKLDDSRLRAKLGLAQYSAPRVSFDFDLDRLDLDRYLPAAADKAAPKTAAKPAAQADTPIDLSALGGFEASGRLRVGELTVHRVKVTDIAAQTRLAGGRLEVSPLGAKLYEGTLAGSLALDAEGNRISARQDLSGVQLGALILDLLGRDVIEGRGKLALDVSGAGASVNAIKKSLAGNARVALQDGAVKGIDLAAALGKAKAGGKPESQPADRERKTRFSEFAASFAVKDGIAHNDDLAIRTAVFRIGGAGDIDLGASRLDYTLKATVFKPSSGEGGELAPLAGLTVPLRVSGPFDAVKFDIDYGAIAASLVKAKAGEKAQKLKGEAGERAREAAKGKLRELLRR